MKRHIRFFLLALLLSATFSSTYGQCGDSCASATPLTVTANGPCNYVPCTNVGATPSGMSGLPCSGVSNNDVWFTFTVPAGVTTLLGQVLGGTIPAMTNPMIYFYRGTCGTLSSIGCGSGFPPASTASFQYSAFIPGEQIWVRVKPLGGTNDGTFQICVYNPCPSGAPLNDEPCTATVVPLMAGCSVYTSLSNFCATHTPGVPAPGCGNYMGGDVWIKTTVGANGQLEVKFEQQSLVDVACALYTGTCSTLTLVACSDDEGAGAMPYLLMTSLIPNDTVWIRVWSHTNIGLGTTGICLSDPCPLGNPPPNDDPCNATVIPIATACGNYVPLSNVCAGGTPGIPNPACGNYQSADVWVQTTVGASGYLFVNFQEQTLHNVAAAMYTGTCSALTPIVCNDDGGDSLMPQFRSTSLVPGTPVWIRVWDNGGGDTGTVGICVFDPCTSGTVIPPLYDNPPCPMPPGAWYVPIVNGECITYTQYNSYCASTVWGTTPAGVPAPVACGGPSYPPGAATGWDVWAPFIIPDTPATGFIEIKTRAGTIDLDMAVYKIATPVDANCANGAMYTFITCDDLGGPGFMPYIRLNFGGSNPVQAGDTILLRMWCFNGGPVGEWEMCINYPCPPGGIQLPGYDEPPCPATAILFPMTNGPCNVYQQADNACATTTLSPGNPNCAQWNNAGDIWYVVQMPASVSGVIEINFQPGLSLTDLGAAVYTGLPVACGGTGLTQIACDDDGGIGALPFFSLTNPVLPGEYLFVRVWDFQGNEFGNIGICISDPCTGTPSSPPVTDDPPCPMPDSASSFLQVTHGLCATYIQCSSRCASPVFGITPAGVPLPSGCSGPTYPPGAATGWDVWTPVVVPDTPIAGTFNIRVKSIGNFTDLDMALYRITPPVSLNCGNGAMYDFIACDDLNGTGTMPFLSLPFGGANTVQPGDTLLVRMWRKNGGATGIWNLAANISDIPSDSICIVRIDSASNRNAVIWEKSGDPQIRQYGIYKDSPSGFTFLSVVNSTAQSMYVDNLSTPSLHADRYAISVVDTCGYEYMLSRPHRTIHLAVTPDTSGGWDLAWNPYEGINYAWTYILRGTSLNNMSVIDSVPALQSVYSDTSAPSFTVYYAVEIRKQPGCFPTPNPNGTLYTNSQSNIVTALGVGLGSDLSSVSGIQIYPNPILHSTEISFSLARAGAVRISVLDIAGREVSLLLNSNLAAGQHRVEWDVSDQSFDPAAGGVYLIRVESGNYSETRRVIVMPR